MRAGFEIIGHRGARGLYPENTLEGFTRAWAMGVRRFETDIAVTADDVPVLCHDPVLNPDITRGPGGAWLARAGPPLRALSLAELGAYDVGRIRPGSGYAARHPEQAPIDGARIPTLAALLAILPDAHLTIELKTDPTRPGLTVPGPCMAELVVAAAAAAGALGRIRVESFDWSGPRHLARTRPEIARAWLTKPATEAEAEHWWGRPRLERDEIARAHSSRSRSLFSHVIPRAGRSASGDHARGCPLARMIAEEGGGAWAPHFLSVTKADMKAAASLGIPVLPWTVNAPEAMRRLADWGAAGLITDRPDRALALFTERGIRGQ